MGKVQKVRPLDALGNAKLASKKPFTASQYQSQLPKRVRGLLQSRASGRVKTGGGVGSRHAGAEQHLGRYLALLRAGCKTAEKT